MAKIGIMGGTFDPIHNGHLLLGRQAYEEYGLDFVWFMPSGQPPHKKDRHVSSMEDRCAMVKLAIEGQKGFVFSDFEVSREGNTYTAQTMKLLKEAYPQHEFSYIIGADSLYEMESWYHPAEVLASVPILVASREYDKEHPVMKKQIDYLIDRYGARIQILHCREINISSEEIRQAVGKGLFADDCVPKGVGQYIRSHCLYREPDTLQKCKGKNRNITIG